MGTPSRGGCGWGCGGWFVWEGIWCCECGQGFVVHATRRSGGEDRKLQGCFTSATDVRKDPAKEGTLVLPFDLYLEGVRTVNGWGETGNKGRPIGPAKVRKKRKMQTVRAGQKVK